MRGFALLSAAALLLACAKSDDRAATDTAMGAAATTEQPAAAAISLADLRGKWKMRALPETGDSTLLEYELDASDSSAWVTNYQNRPPVKNRIVAVSGDSVVTESGPYPSMLRKNVNVTTHTVYRLQNGKLVGTTVAHYSASGPDSVRRLRQEGTRTP